MTETIAYMITSTVEDLNLQERCSNHNDTWENTIDIFMDEAAKEERNPIFWEAVENMAKVIKEFTS